MNKAFQDLKEAICAHVELSYPDYSTDAEKLQMILLLLWAILFV